MKKLLLLLPILFLFNGCAIMWEGKILHNRYIAETQPPCYYPSYNIEWLYLPYWYTPLPIWNPWYWQYPKPYYHNYWNYYPKTFEKYIPPIRHTPTEQWIKGRNFGSHRSRR